MNDLRIERATLHDLLLGADALRRPERLDGLLRACAADALSRPGRGSGHFAPAQLFEAALAVVRNVDAGKIAAARPDARDLPQRIRTARLKSLRTWMRNIDA